MTPGAVLLLARYCTYVRQVEAKNGPESGGFNARLDKARPTAEASRFPLTYD